MALRCRAIPAAAGRVWNRIPTSCHMATLYWLHDAEFRALEGANEFAAAFANPTNIMSRMLGRGRRLTKPRRGNLALTPGSVIVFAMNGNAKHSCIAHNHNTISGYNQVNWFNTVGLDHGLSTHSVNDIRWQGFLNREVQGNSAPNSPCQLIAIPEATARAFIRQIVQG